MLMSGLADLSYFGLEIQAGCQVKIQSGMPNKMWKCERDETGGKEGVCVL